MEQEFKVTVRVTVSCDKKKSEAFVRKVVQKAVDMLICDYGLSVGGKVTDVIEDAKKGEKS